MAAERNFEEFFQAADFKISDVQVAEVFHEFRELVDGVWARALDGLWARALEYLVIAHGIWHTHTQTHLKRFQSLPADDQRKFMHSGLDGAAVFLLLTMISRSILTKFLEPFLLRNFQNVAKQGKQGSSLTFKQAKWLFSSALLFTVWHANSHAFFDLGLPVDLSLMLATVSAISYMIYQQSWSVKSCLAFFAVPVLILMPVSMTVGVMQHGPYISQPKMFPALLAAVTVMTAVHFIFEAPSTLVVKSGQFMPFGVALRREIDDLWHGGWLGRVFSAFGRFIDTFVRESPKIGEKFLFSGRKTFGSSGERATDLVTHQEQNGRVTIQVTGWILQPIFASSHHFSFFLLGLIDRLKKFLYFLYRLVIDAISLSLHKMSDFAKNFHRRDGGHAAFSAAWDQSNVNERHGRSKTPTGGKPKFSRKVSRSRKDDEDKESLTRERNR